METLEELGKLGETIGAGSIGCSVQAHKFMNVDIVRVRPRPRAGGGHGHQARPPRQACLHLPGRRGPGLHRHGRDRPCGGTGREIHHVLHQQLHLRHDLRPDGADDAHRPEDHSHPRPGARVEQAGMPIRMAELISTLETAPSTWSASPSIRPPTSARRKRPSNAPSRFRRRELGFSFVEDPLHLPDELGHHAARRHEVGGREYDPVLPPGSLQESRRMWQ